MKNTSKKCINAVVIRVDRKVKHSDLESGSKLQTEIVYEKTFNGSLLDDLEAQRHFEYIVNNWIWFASKIKLKPGLNLSKHKWDDCTIGSMCLHIDYGTKDQFIRREFYVNFPVDVQLSMDLSLIANSNI